MFPGQGRTHQTGSMWLQEKPSALTVRTGTEGFFSFLHDLFTVKVSLLNSEEVFVPHLI